MTTEMIPADRYTADVIRDLRRAARMSQEQFAYELQSTVFTVSRWETGKNVPSPKMRGKLQEFARRLRVRQLAYTTVA